MYAAWFECLTMGQRYGTRGKTPWRVELDVPMNNRNKARIRHIKTIGRNSYAYVNQTGRIQPRVIQPNDTLDWTNGIY